MRAHRLSVPVALIALLLAAEPAGRVSAPIGVGAVAASHRRSAPVESGIVASAAGPGEDADWDSEAIRSAPYVDGQYLVAPPAGTSIHRLAAQVRGEVIAPVGRAGYGVIRLDGPDARAALAASGASVSPLGRIVGAAAPLPKRKGGATAQAQPVAPPNWHLQAIGAPTVAGQRYADQRVAVLDTGVAYETRAGFVQATGLAGIAFEDPLDLVEGDEHPNDDHQHGTHVTSLIAGQGVLPGVAPGVTIVPIKVLDATNAGTEYALIEGLYHAIDHDVDVINLSLSFPLGYAPSTALRDALAAAWDADIVVVAAAGNDGANEPTWPAAARTVVAVGASRSVWSYLGDQTAYSNRSPRLDCLAPGGDLSGDYNGDGYVDGVVAETIGRNDPAHLGYWAYQGTSQAAALVSGVVVQMLRAGVAPHDVGPALQASRDGFDPWSAMLSGVGAEIVDLGDAVDGSAGQQDVYVGLLPYLVDHGGRFEPRAKVTVVDGTGARIASAEVLGSLYDAAGVTWPLCVTGADGACTLTSSSWLAGSSSAWAFRVDAVVVDDVAQRPSRAVFGSPGAEALLAALGALPDGSFDAVGVYWPAGPEPELGLLSEAWAVLDLGLGPVAAPSGVLFRPSAVTAVVGSLAVDVDATGLLSSPVGTLSLKTLTFSGSGLLSSPVGTLSYKLVGLDGSGLLSSPIGFSGSGLLSSPVGMSILLDQRTLTGASDGYALLTTELSPTDALIGSGSVSVALTPSFGATQASAASPAVQWLP